MVSLGNESGRSGGYFFDANDHSHSIRSNDSEELLQENHSLVTELEPSYQHIKSTWIIVLQILLMISLEVFTFVTPLLCDTPSCHSYDVTLYMHAGLWFILILCDFHLNHIHNRSRMAGYLDFYRQTKCIRRVAIFVNSLVNVILVAVTALIYRYCRDKCGPLTSNNILQILVSIEVFIIIVCLIVYLCKTTKFNRTCSVPDIQRDELATGFAHNRSMSAEVGFKDDDYLDQVLEKQADMIRYLKQHSAHLAKRVLTLTDQLNEAKVTSSRSQLLE